MEITSLMVSIYCSRFLAGFLECVTAEALVVSIMHVAERTKVGGRALNVNLRIVVTDQLILVSCRCDFDDTAQYRVSAMNSQGEQSAFASIVVKSKRPHISSPP